LNFKIVLVRRVSMQKLTGAKRKFDHIIESALRQQDDCVAEQYRALHEFLQQQSNGALSFVTVAQRIPQRLLDFRKNRSLKLVSPSISAEAPLATATVAHENIADDHNAKRARRSLRLVQKTTTVNTTTAATTTTVPELQRDSILDAGQPERRRSSRLLMKTTTVSSTAVGFQATDAAQAKPQPNATTAKRRSVMRDNSRTKQRPIKH
jgi:hypothetical protein